MFFYKTFERWKIAMSRLAYRGEGGKIKLSNSAVKIKIVLSSIQK
jgi:hypothetical protein